MSSPQAIRFPAMQVNWPILWRAVKVALALLIVGGVGWQFAKILRRPELWQQPVRLDAAWLALAGLLYAAGFACWGSFWRRLVCRLGEALPWPAAARAYFVSQLGKYVPGKAIAIVMRVAMARSAGVRTGVAAITATYETLTTIAAGAIVAAVLFPFLGGDSNNWWKALALLAVAGIPILPGVFNRLAARVARPFTPRDSLPLPRLTTGALLGGLAQTAVGWFCLGASLLALLQGVGVGTTRPDVPWLTGTAFVALAYVAGFVTLPAPGGLGVREAILQQLLARHLAPQLGEAPAESYAVIVVLLLRLTWTVTELTLAGAAALLPRSAPRNASA